MGDENAVDVQIEKATQKIINESEINEKVKKIIDLSEAISGNEKNDLLLKSITLIDLTSLKGGETFEDIHSLCDKAVNSVNVSFEGNRPVATAAVCVFPASAQNAIKALKGLNARDKVNVASVAADFPAAQLPLQQRIDEIKQVVDYGVDEVDIVINRKLALSHKWKELYNELKLMREACGKTKMKTILATGDLPTMEDVYVASMVAILAGSDFIKTSTGKEAVNATLPVGIVMALAIKDYYNISSKKIGFKPAGGIRTSADTIQWMTLIKQELGQEWLNKNLFRIGTSTAHTNIVNSILNFVNHE